MRRLWVCTLFLLFALTACQKQGVFRPEVSPIPVSNDVILGEPILVSFTELANNLERYQNVLIRVTGVYTPLSAPGCSLERGPRTRWSLVGEGKQMKVIRFEQVVVPLAWEGLTMTLDGVWRKYEGPLGCGKNAPSGVIWYLEAMRIVDPNPIPDYFLENTPPAEPDNDSTPEISSDETPIAPVEGTPTNPGYPVDVTPTVSAFTPTPTPTRLVLPSLTPTGPVTTAPTIQVTTPAAATPSGTPTPTPTATPTTGTATPTGTVTPTPGPGTPSVTPLSTTPPEPTTTGYPAPY